MLPPVPPDVARHCRIGNHDGCTSPACACPCHCPGLVEIEEAAGWPEPADPAADLQQALAALYAQEARAEAALATASRHEARRLLAEIVAISRTCTAAIDPDAR